MFCVFQLKFQHLDLNLVNYVSYNPLSLCLVVLGRSSSLLVIFVSSLGPVDSADVPFSNLRMPSQVDQPIPWIAFGERLRYCSALLLQSFLITCSDRHSYSSTYSSFKMWSSKNLHSRMIPLSDPRGRITLLVKMLVGKTETSLQKMSDERNLEDWFLKLSLLV